MKLKSIIAAISIILIMLFTLPSCEEGESGRDNDSFDRAAMLESLATGLIIPNFEALQQSVTQLETAADAFITNSTEENLQRLRDSWQQATIDYQHCSAFGFGPADLTLGPFATVLGVFPVNENAIETNITDPEFNLTSSFQRDVRGFYAIEYLIYGNEQTIADIIQGYDDDRKHYLHILVDELKTTCDAIVEEWNTTYLSEFISSDGTSAGSSISQLYNEFVKDYENLKNFKVELPAGLTAGQTGPEPRLVEAYYSGISLTLIRNHFDNSVNIWEGKSKTGENLIGFEEYLQTVVGGDDLILQTKEAIGRIDAAIVAIPGETLATVVDTDEVRNLRDELQTNTANFKSSMSSLLGISITFNSGDGD